MTVSIFVGTTCAHPVIYLRNLELPKSPNTMGRQALAINPSINRVARYTQMLGNLVD
jgi:hypothetical protein